MKFRTTTEDRLRLGAVTLGTLLVWFIAWNVIGEAALVLLTVLCLAVVFVNADGAGWTSQGPTEPRVALQFQTG